MLKPQTINEVLAKLGSWGYINPTFSSEEFNFQVLFYTPNKDIHIRLSYDKEAERFGVETNAGMLNPDPATTQAVMAEIEACAFRARILNQILLRGENKYANKDN